MYFSGENFDAKAVTKLSDSMKMAPLFQNDPQVTQNKTKKLKQVENKINSPEKSSVKFQLSSRLRNNRR